MKQQLFQARTLPVRHNRISILCEIAFEASAARNRGGNAMVGQHETLGTSTGANSCLRVWTHRKGSESYTCPVAVEFFNGYRCLARPCERAH